MIHNGLLVNPDDFLYDGDVNVVPRLVGGKGGFGSMLRAIGAQIEKTTNREACRDLSGRRLRDINAEKRLKEWLENNKDNKDDKTERLKRKIQRLLAQPKHEFKDKAYEEQRSNLTENVGSAVEEGFKVAAGASGVKRTHSETQNGQKRKKTILDSDSDSDDSSSIDSSLSDEDDEEKEEATTKSEENNVAAKKSTDNSSSESEDSN